MTPENFVYWLRGALELFGEQALTKEQVAAINQHLSLVLHEVPKEVLVKLGTLDVKGPTPDRTLQDIVEEMRRADDWTVDSAPRATLCSSGSPKIC